MTQYLPIGIRIQSYNRALSRSLALLLSKLNNILSGCFDPENIFRDNKIVIFWGDLTDTLAKQDALQVTRTVSRADDVHALHALFRSTFPTRVYLVLQSIHHTSRCAEPLSGLSTVLLF